MLVVFVFLNYLFFLIAIKLEEAKVQKSIKEAAKKGDRDVCTILAKEIIQSRTAVNKIYAAKAQLNSVDMQMKTQLCKWYKLLFPMIGHSLLLKIINSPPGCHELSTRRHRRHHSFSTYAKFSEKFVKN